MSISFYNFDSSDFTDEIIESKYFQRGLKEVIRDIRQINGDIKIDPKIIPLPAMLSVDYMDDDLKEVISKATDIHQPEWYGLLHFCDIISVFIVYPMLKFKYPDMPLYLCIGVGHVYISNYKIEEPITVPVDDYEYSKDISKNMIFDLLGWCIKLGLKNIYFDNNNSGDIFLYPEGKILDGYIEHYRYKGIEQDTEGCLR